MLGYFEPFMLIYAADAIFFRPGPPLGGRNMTESNGFGGLEELYQT